MRKFLLMNFLWISAALVSLSGCAPSSSGASGLLPGAPPERTSLCVTWLSDAGAHGSDYRVVSGSVKHPQTLVVVAQLVESIAQLEGRDSKLSSYENRPLTEGDDVALVRIRSTGTRKFKVQSVALINDGKGDFFRIRFEARPDAKTVEALVGWVETNFMAVGEKTENGATLEVRLSPPSG